MPTKIEEALDGFSMRELEELKNRVERRLQSCMIDGQPEAVAVRATVYNPSNHNPQVISLMLCYSCIQKYRLPRRRSEKTPEEPA